MMSFPEEIFQKALALHRSGDLDAAESLYQQLLHDNPDHTDLLHLLSILCGQQGRLQDALQYVSKALVLEPNSATFHNTLANVERRMGHRENAMSHYHQALVLMPESASIHNNIGVLHDEQAQYEEAIRYYRAALRLKPDYSDAACNLSNMLTKQGEFEEAIDVLEKALPYHPEHAQIRAHLGQLCLRVSRYTQAIEHSEACLALDPDNVEAHHQLAVALTHEDCYDEAVLHYHETLKRDPEHAEALHNLGALYLVKREPDLALTCYLRLLLLKPDLDTYYNLGVIYFYQDKHEDAINYFSEVLALDPNHLNAHLNLGACCIKKENFAKAIEHYKIASSLKPNDPEILYILSALTQENLPNTTPTPYIENLFDQYAPHFDQHLTKYLNYAVPDILLKAVTNVVGAKEAGWDVLDLGCGTGLCGQRFQPFAKRLIGVDLSEKMLEMAGEKAVYDVLEKMDIHAAIEKYAPLDLIIAGDVLGYIGDLERLFALVKNGLREKGIFAFTIEKMYGDRFGLQPNARFAHSKAYIHELAAKCGLTIVCEENAVLRMQKQEQVVGYVFILTLLTPS